MAPVRWPFHQIYKFPQLLRQGFRPKSKHSFRISLSLRINRFITSRVSTKWTGDIAWSGVAGEMKGTHSEILMGLNGGNDLVCVRHGLVPIAQPIQETGYLIDHDFFVNGQFSMKEVGGKLTEYHQAAQRFFKLWVTDTLHHAMKPKS
jgi:uncharacterized protein (TIGR04255 family)